MKISNKIKISVIVFFSVVVFALLWLMFFLPPKVSIVMPVYNGEKYLDKTIGFLLQSQFRDFEFIVIDDKSTDNSYQKLLEFAEIDKRIKVYKNEKNMGIVKTRNKGMKLAKGKYIAPMDQDDWSLPERLKVSVEWLDEHDDIDVVDVGTITMKDYFRGIKNERAGAVSYLMKTLENEKANYSDKERDENIKFSLLFSLAVPTQSASMMRKSFLIEHDIWYKEGILYSDDYYLYADMVKNGANFHHIDDIYHIYNDIREHSNEFNQKQYEETFNVKKQLFEMIGLNIDDYKDDFNDMNKFVCRVLEDILESKEDNIIISNKLAQKNFSLLCKN